MSAHPAILVPGKMHPHVLKRLKDRFEVIEVKRSPVLELDPETCQKIRGVAVSGPFNAHWMHQLPALEIIANFGVGYDNIDVTEAASRQIIVTNTPDVLTDEVADTAIALLLNTVRNLPRAETWVREGLWQREGAFDLSRFSLKGRRVGLYGLGRIGLEIAKRLEPFKVKISYHTRHRQEALDYHYHPTLQSLAQAVDTLIVVVPKTEQTHKTVNHDILQALGPDGILINIGRGWSVDEDALVNALQSGQLGGAGLDVFYDEPHVPQELLTLPHVSLLPHIGSASEPTRKAMADLVADNLVAWFETQNVLTPVPETPIPLKS